jgi:hypothetical protein
MPTSAKQFHKRSAPHLMTCAVRGIAETGAPDIDERLYRLLTGAIDTARRLQPPTPATDSRPATAEPRAGRRGLTSAAVRR